jgi:hypothetical protein
MSVQVFRALRSKFDEQLRNGVLGNPGHANRRTNRIALKQCANHLSLLGFI